MEGTVPISQLQVPGDEPLEAVTGKQRSSQEVTVNS